MRGSTTTPQMLLDGQAVDVSVAANPLSGVVASDQFNVDIWSKTGAFGGGTVNIYMLAPPGGDDTPILLEAFTEATCRVGLNGNIGRVIKAEVVGASGADISASISS